jgi:hypothetical protein
MLPVADGRFKASRHDGFTNFGLSLVMQCGHGEKGERCRVSRADQSYLRVS